jgi:hypothetical protein
MGLAVHYKQSKLYWVDTDISLGYHATVIRTYDLDGSTISQAYLYDNDHLPGGVPVQANATDIVLNLRNNTLYFISNVPPPPPPLSPFLPCANCETSGRAQRDRHYESQ